MFALNNYHEPLVRGSRKIAFPARSRLTTLQPRHGRAGTARRPLLRRRALCARRITRLNSVSGEGEADSVGQFFHILGAVEQQNGCCEVRPGEYERTIYTSCWNADRGIYYYTTYTNRRISAVELRREDLDAAALIRYPMRTREDIFYQNAPGTES